MPLLPDPGVPRGGKRILETDLHVAAAQRGAIGQVVRRPTLVARCMLDQKPGLPHVVPVIQRGGGIHSGGIRLRGWSLGTTVEPLDAPAPTPDVAQRAPGHPQQEQVQHGEETELQSE